MAERAHKIVKMQGSGVHNKRSRFKIRYLIVVAFLLWGGYVYWFVQRPLIHQEAVAQERMQEQLQSASSQTEHLNQMISNLYSYSYIATLSEQRYNLIMPGEILFTSSTSKNSSN